MKWKIFLAILATCFTLGLSATRAEAQATRTWVSGVGDDANPCSRTAPCKTFAGAISKTAAGGEINCLDPGGFGAVTITKSITIDCTGTLGGILAVEHHRRHHQRRRRRSSSCAACRSTAARRPCRASTASASSRPRRSPSRTCRSSTSAPPRRTAFGIIVNNTSDSISLNVINTVITTNGTATSGAGITIVPTGTGAVVANISNSDIGNNFRGIFYAGNGTTAGSGSLTVTNTRMYRNTDAGLTVTSGANGVPTMLSGLVINNSANGIVLTGSGVQARLGNSVISFNGTAVASTGGAGLQSYQNNQIDFNSNNSTPLPVATPQ